MSGEPRYKWVGPSQALPLVEICEDCGAVVAERKAHTRFHAILGDHGRAVAMLLVAHIAPHVHDRYDVKDRFDAKRNENNWSAEAFAEHIDCFPFSGANDEAFADAYADHDEGDHG